MIVRSIIVCVGLALVPMLHTMEMNEKELKKYAKKHGKKEGSVEQLSEQERNANSVRFFEVVDAQDKGWEKTAEKILKQGIDPEYRDPKTKQSLLEVWIEHKPEVRNKVIKQLVHVGVPFSSQGAVTNNLLDLCLTKYEKNLKAHFNEIPTKGAAYEIKQALYGYIADRVTLIHTRNIAPLAAFKRFKEQKNNNIIARQLQKKMVEMGQGYELLEDLCLAFNQVSQENIYFQMNVEKHFELNFWESYKWKQDYNAFYKASDIKNVSKDNLFKKFLYWKK